VALENKIDIENNDRIEIVHTDKFVTMEDAPLCVKGEKADSSMATGLRMLCDGEGDAFVSAGNTGALFAGANLIVRKIKGIRRPAIAALLPMEPPVLLVDSGANTDVTPECLEGFAIMGAEYMERVHGVEKARVGLLNNGTEATKGTELQREAYGLLSCNGEINFVGNIEANMIMKDSCDVLVTDGFTGNILLKSMEGMGKLALTTLKELLLSDTKGKLAALLVHEKVADVKKRFDGGALGGAPMLGISKPVIKAHGASDAREFKNAIRQAELCANNEVCRTIADRAQELVQKRKNASGADRRAECEDGK